MLILVEFILVIYTSVLTFLSQADCADHGNQTSAALTYSASPAIPTPSLNGLTNLSTKPP